MTRLHPYQLPGILGLLLLATTPVLHADDRGKAPNVSPYRLVINSDSVSSVNRAPYLLDQRYRLEPAVDLQRVEKPYSRQIDAAARAAGVDPALVHALVAVESAYQSAAVSPKGAVGLMQVMPETALRYGVIDPSGVSDNLRAGTRHLRSLMERYDDRIDLALAAYNAGEGAVKRYNNTIPPYAETRHYVPAVIDRYEADHKRTALKSTRKLPVHDYLPGTRLDSQALSRLQ